jgi:hypothetical protein
VLITPSLGVPNWPVIYIINTGPPTSFLAPLTEIELHFPTSTTRQQNAKQCLFIKINNMLGKQITVGQLTE